MIDQDPALRPDEAAAWTPDAAPPAPAVAQEKAPAYAYYALALLVAANFFNYVDRQIVSILAQSLKAAFGLTDAQLGFLLGTAFAMLYGVVGIAIGRIADAVSRTGLMAFGLALWSAMTAASGMALSYLGLAGARIGVGIGEASANPTANSLLADYFPQRNRATVMGAYLLGASLGGMGALFLGGSVLQHWGQICQALPIGGACHLASWRAAFFIVGVPGLILAALVAGLREPPRRASLPATPLLQIVAREFSAAIPPFTLFSLYRAGGARAMWRNLALTAGLAAIVLLLGVLTHDWAQWVAVSIGVYSISTWAQVLSYRDKPLFMLTYGCPTFVLSLSGGALLASISATMGAWAAPLAIRKLGMSPGEAGLTLGVTYATAACISVVLSGLATDHWKRRDVRAPLWMTMISVIGAVPALALMLLARDRSVYMVGYFLLGVVNMGWGGAFAALVQDLVLPRMRAAASAAFTLVIIVVSSGVGPYLAGKISTLTGSLTTGLWSLQAFAPVAVVVLLLAANRMKHETEEGRRARARAAGENI